MDDIEAQAALKGLQMMSKIGFKELILEGDSLINIELLTQDLVRHFEAVEEFHLAKQGNEAAHALARFAQQVDPVARWWYQISVVIAF